MNETITTWTDIDTIVAELENKESELFERNFSSREEIESEKCHQEYNIESDIQYLQKDKNVKSIIERPYELVKKPQVLEETKFYKIMRMFNPKHERIVKHIVYENKKIQMTHCMYL